MLCKNILLAQYTCNELLVAGCDTHLHTAIQGAPAAADSEHHQGQWRREKRKTVCPHITHVTSVLSTKNAKSASHTQSDNLCFACPCFSKKLYNFLLEKKKSLYCGSPTEPPHKILYIRSSYLAQTGHAETSGGTGFCKK